MSSFNVGDRIRLHTRPPYLKSADPMPMLRPPDLVAVGEEGTVLSRKPGGYLGIRFSQGAFLVDAQYVEIVEAAAQQGLATATDNSTEAEDIKAAAKE